MLKTCEFKISGKPMGKGRPRFTRSGHTYTPKDTVEYENRIQRAAWASMQRSQLTKTTNRVSLYLPLTLRYQNRTQKRNVCFVKQVI